MKEVTRRFHVGSGGVVAVTVFQRLKVPHSLWYSVLCNVFSGLEV